MHNKFCEVQQIYFLSYAYGLWTYLNRQTINRHTDTLVTILRIPHGGEVITDKYNNRDLGVNEVH